MNLRRFLHPAKIAQKLYLLATDQAAIVDLGSLIKLQKEVENARRYDNLQSMKPPVFIFGPPRSGSTYLVQAMNAHERIYITDELRVMSFINDLFRLFLKSDRTKWNLSSPNKDAFLKYFRREMANVVKGYYLERMPGPDAIWGDKHPHYSDPAMDPGALSTILELFPDAKFIHIYRNPRNQIHSVITKGWKDFRYSVHAYRRIVTVGRAIGKEVGPDRYLEMKYENLRDHGENVVIEICHFLGIPPSEKWLAFMRQQELKRTPYAAPVTTDNELGMPKRISFTSEEEAYFEKILGKLEKQLGYSP